MLPTIPSRRAGVDAKALARGWLDEVEKLLQQDCFILRALKPQILAQKPIVVNTRPPSPTSCVSVLDILGSADVTIVAVGRFEDQ